MAIILDYDSSRLNNRERMLICNYVGVFDKASQMAFAKLMGVENEDILYLSIAAAIKIREKLKKEVRK